LWIEWRRNDNRKWQQRERRNSNTTVDECNQDIVHAVTKEYQQANL
jgi:hypothetical protein